MVVFPPKKNQESKRLPKMNAKTVLLVAFALWCQPAFVDAQNTEKKQAAQDLVEFERPTTDLKQAALVWKKLIESLEFAESNHGRMIVCEFDIGSWEHFSKEFVPPGTLPNRLLVGDFANDFVLEQSRCDWYEVPLSKKPDDLLEERPIESQSLFDRFDIPKLEKTGLFKLEQINRFKILNKTILTPDFRSSWRAPTRFGRNAVYISLPSGRSDEWPCNIDTRLIGWCSMRQILSPTTAPLWRQITDKFFKPFSYEEFDSSAARLGCLQADKRYPSIWFFDCEKIQGGQIRIKSVQKNYLRNAELPQNDRISMKKTAEFKSFFYYESEILTSIVSINSTSGKGYRFDFDVHNDEIPDRDFFDSLALEEKAEVVFDSAIEESLKKAILFP